MERLHNGVRAEEEFQRGYLLKNPDMATKIEHNKLEKERLSNKRLNLPVSRKPRRPPQKLTHVAESEVIRLYDDRTRLYSYSQRELALKFKVTKMLSP